MNSRIYTFKKKEILKEEVDFLYLFFDNGDGVEIDKSELVDLSFKTYERLVYDNQGYAPVAANGFIKLKISDIKKIRRRNHRLADNKAFVTDRKGYVENRCLTENGINKIWFFNDLNWHYPLLCSVLSRMEKEYLVLEFIPNPTMGAFDSDTHKIMLGALNKDYVSEIMIDCENCESFQVYDEEILDINLTMDKQLVWGASEIYRNVTSGYIILRLNDKYDDRQHHLFVKNANVTERINDTVFAITTFVDAFRTAARLKVS